MRLPDLIRRLSAICVLLGCGAFLGLEIYAIADLHAFEFHPLRALLGIRGILFIVALNVGMLALCYRVLSANRPVSPKLRWATNVAILAAALLAAWALEWMFMETPATTRVELAFFKAPSPDVDGRDQADFDSFSLVKRAPGAAARRDLAVMYERTVIVNPAAFERAPLGATIDRYAERYRVDPIFLFFRAYLNSYYGEATSGRVPFLETMTAETIRDVVQIHLPGWFIESPIRTHLISDTTLESAFGKAFGWKLRYAIHKANLDVSTQPYDLNTYSDTFLMLKVHPEAFPDVLGAQVTDPLDLALRDAFMSIRAVGLIEPYEAPYRTRPLTGADYDRYRKDLERFARAAYYKTALDFDFATRVQALLAARDQFLYRVTLGAERWDGLPPWQRTAMLNMTRDVFEPYVGRLGYNLYSLPELNRTPIAFVIARALEAGDELGPTMQSLWRPRDYELLWGAAGYQQTVLSEVWSKVTGNAIPGVHVAETLDDARQVIWLDARFREP